MQVYAAVRRIPRGKVATYGQLARLTGYPLRARMVWQALSYAPESIPCHRVVNSAGRLAPHFSAQRERLEAEGVAFRPNGNVDLRRCLWREEWE